VPSGQKECYIGFFGYFFQRGLIVGICTFPTMSRQKSATRAVTVERAFRKIVLAVDGPEKSGKAIELAMTLAAANGADLDVVHVSIDAIPIVAPPAFGMPPPVPSRYFELQQRHEDRMSRWLARIVGLAEERGLNAKMSVLRPRLSVAEEVAKKASDDGADLIVVGMNERSALERLVYGSTSRGVIQHAECPVLVVR
jgi:nucleotide-binding universal stress UspA family protein